MLHLSRGLCIILPVVEFLFFVQTLPSRCLPLPFISIIINCVQKPVNRHNWIWAYLFYISIRWFQLRQLVTFSDVFLQSLINITTSTSTRSYNRLLKCCAGRCKNGPTCRCKSNQQMSAETCMLSLNLRSDQVAAAPAGRTAATRGERCWWHLFKLFKFKERRLF